MILISLIQLVGLEHKRLSRQRRLVPIMIVVHKMVKHTMKTLQQMLQII